MKKNLASIVIALWSGFCLAAPPPEKLLPQDTLMVLTIPDAVRMREFQKNSPQNRMWHDPAMRPFRERFWTRFSADVIAPLETELGVKLSDYADLAQGQVTLALTQGDLLKSPGGTPSLLLILDSKDHAKELEAKLAELKKKWAGAGKPVRTDKIRGVSFNIVTVSADDISKLGDSLKNTLDTPGSEPKPNPADPAPAKVGANAKKELFIGQSDSLLIVSSSQVAVEQLLARQSGTGAAGLDEDTDFRAAQNSMFRDAPVYFWLNLKPIVAAALKALPQSPAPNAAENSNSSVPNFAPAAPDFQKLVASLGLQGFKSLQFSLKDAGNGRMLLVGLRVDESGPQGLLKMLSADAKDSAPPAFVPADVVKFNRYRLDLQRMWNTLEKMAREAYPPVSSALDLVFKNAGKEKDPNYDLRKELIGNLGDDIIGYQKAPNSSSPADIKSPPSITFISSPNAEGLIQAIKTALPLMAPIELKDREFLGRKIYNTGATPGQPDQGISLAASGGYLAISTSPELVEDFIRSSDHPGKALREDGRLRDAAEKLGGTDTGMFGFDNESDSLRSTWDFLRKNSAEAVAAMMSSAGQTAGGQNLGKAKDWFDFSLLPPFDAVAKYLSVSAYSSSFKSSGVEFKMYFPDPPELRR